jgi:hypothetical protein
MIEISLLVLGSKRQRSASSDVPLASTNAVAFPKRYSLRREHLCCFVSRALHVPRSLISLSPVFYVVNMLTTCPHNDVAMVIVLALTSNTGGVFDSLREQMWGPGVPDRQVLAGFPHLGCTIYREREPSEQSAQLGVPEQAIMQKPITW